MPRIDSTPTRACSRQDLELIDAYWRAANYLSTGWDQGVLAIRFTLDDPARFARYEQTGVDLKPVI